MEPLDINFASKDMKKKLKDAFIKGFMTGLAFSVVARFLIVFFFAEG